MSTNKSRARKFLEELRGGPLTFGQMISSLRLADEITQVGLARKMKISRAHLCDIENGRRTVSIERAAEFAKVLGYSVNQFVAVALEDQAREAGLKVKIFMKAA
ncbi:MAG TPA: helix-turn-helix transcriptional regulator [Bdellovibrionota bacterium]|nr:helix-turn-helix transcriptional regulator [Bdellovibrionota bacterium]